MNTFYSNEKNVQILISLMKKHHVKKIVISPGGTNPTFVGSVQQDPYFELYSSVDERSAAYMACGLAAESGEPVALSCTGATASRNYVPALTEAYYSKLPVLVITSSQYSGKVGHHIPQVTDRSTPMSDIVTTSVLMPNIHNDDEEWTCIVGANKALLELRHRGGGPVHINLETSFSKDFSVKELPDIRVINRFTYGDELPLINKDKVAIFVGNHHKWTDRLTNQVDMFCEKYGAVVLCDQTSNYNGSYRVMPSIVSAQSKYNSPLLKMDLLIHIGEISGAYLKLYPKNVWRVNLDGEVRDTFRKLSNVFEMKEEDFFEKYAEMKKDKAENTYYEEWKQEIKKLTDKIPELPLSNIWMAKQVIPNLPDNSVVHLGILNSLRSANFFSLPKSVCAYANTGGFGIDGPISTLLGSSLANPDKLHFGIVGDLAFFYDMNAIGSRHVGKNIRILLVNNGCGAEFTLHNSHDYDVGVYTAAAGHFGNKSRELVKHYSQDLGFEYKSAETKEEFVSALKSFLSPNIGDKPMVLEVFVESENESKALNIMESLEVTTVGMVKQVAKDMLGRKGAETIKKAISKR